MSGIECGESDVEAAKAWIASRNAAVRVSVARRPFAALRGWRFDARSGNLVHESGRFFSVVGLDVYANAGRPSRWMQPIVDQPEVGMLGILTREIDGVPHCLLQAKVEPGNVNGVQLSPTVQATRSNCLQVHGGRRPKYLDFFLGAKREQIVLDQLQSEQGARFFRKRNRNMIVRISEDVAEDENFRWMSLPLVKALMRCDNVVNMDTRTVLSGWMEFCREGGGDDERPHLSMDDILFRLSALKSRYELVVEKVGLREVDGWRIGDDEIVRPDRQFFRVVGVEASISNREVSTWCQPMVEPMQEGLCVLFEKRIRGVPHYLLQAKVECGNFDVVELAPTIQCLTGPYRTPIGYVPRFLPEFLKGELPGRIRLDVLQSEEGGRFYHEQNRNVVFEIDPDAEIPEEDGFLWLTVRQMKELLRFNNILNIQVRSLVSIL